MPGRRSVPPQTQPQIKEFRSVEDIDQAIAKIKRRIAEVQALDARSVQWEDQRVRKVEKNIHTTLLEVFGPGSPEYNANGNYRFVSLFAGGNLGDDYCQGEFAKHIAQAARMLENLVARLQEKRADLGHDTAARRAAPSSRWSCTPASQRRPPTSIVTATTVVLFSIIRSRS